jgi:hypothetical protein
MPARVSEAIVLQTYLLKESDPVVSFLARNSASLVSCVRTSSNKFTSWAVPLDRGPTPSSALFPAFEQRPRRAGQGSGADEDGSAGELNACQRGSHTPSLDRHVESSQTA